MRKLEYYEMTTLQVRTGIKKALLGSLEVLGYARDILERGGNSGLALELYISAIEEYGKSELLRECLLNDSKICHVPKTIFDNKNFTRKFEKYLSKTPDETREIFSAEILSNFQTTTGRFSLDWDEEKEKWRTPPKVESDVLSKSISAFEKHISAKIDSEYGT